MENKRSMRALPYRYYYIPVLLLVLLGLADTAYLTISHYRNYTDISYSSFCAVSKAINCDTVSQSPWSILLGLPVAIWGFFGYLLYGIIVSAAHKKDAGRIHLWSILFILAGLYAGGAIYFGYISASKIHSYCILCILSYCISFSLLFYAWIIRRRFDRISLGTSLGRAFSFIAQNRYLKIGILGVCLALAGTSFTIPHYWTYAISPVTADLATGMTKDYHPWIGAEDPALTIEEYSDYQCFQCYKMHFMLRRLIAQYPDKIRLIHHQFPMDNTVNEIIVPTPFHVGAGKMAMIAIYAALKGKFWETNDLLFKLGRGKKTFNTKILARKTGIPARELAAATKNPTIRLLLKNDIRRGMKLHITGTPAFVIDDKVYTGSIPAEILEQAIK